MKLSFKIKQLYVSFSIVFVCFLVLIQGAVSQTRRELVIVTFGNSTTALRKGIDKVYAVRIQELLNEAGINNKVINSGVGSSHSGSIKDNSFSKVVHAMDRFQTAVLDHHPDWVTLNFGLNDAYQDKGLGTESRIPLDKFIDNLNYFIARIKENNGRVIVLTPNPVGSKLDKFRYERLTLYRKAAKKIARSNDVEFIDTWKLFYRHSRKDLDGIDSLLPDGTHPNDTGHKLIAESIVKKIIRSVR